MRQYTVLQSIIKKNMPVLDTLPTHKKKKVLKQILDENLVSILLKVEIPDPIEFRREMMKEHYLNLRRRKEAQHKEKNFNYNLWRKLYEAKNKLKYNISENSQLSVDESIGFSSTINRETGVSADTNWKIPNTTSASSILKNINQVTSNIEVSKELQAKMVISKSHEEFVTCINNTCKSYEVEKLGFAEYLLHEKKDMENPKWQKIILDAQFYEKDFEKKMDLWEELRELVDSSIDKLKHETHNLEEVKELEKQFYINLCK